MNVRKFFSWLQVRGLHELFEIGVVLKGINAVLELASGLLLLVVDVRGIVETLVEDHLVDDPHDFLATHIQGALQKLSPGAEVYSGLYLISHGAVKMVLVWGLLKKKLWAYPASLVVLAFFIVYQTYKLLQTHSIALLLLTIFDASLMYLIWREYHYMRKKWASSPSDAAGQL
jgi:uncharacterized membrane protein